MVETTKKRKLFYNFEELEYSFQTNMYSDEECNKYIDEFTNVISNPSKMIIKACSDSDNETKSIGIRTEIQATNKEKIKFYAVTKLTVSNKLSLITYSEIDHYEITENNSYHIYEIKTNYLNNSPNASKSIPYFEEKIVKGLDRDRATKETIKRLMGDKMYDEEDFYGYLFQPLALCLKNSIFKIDTIWYKFYFNKEFKCIEIENSDLKNYYNGKKVCD